MKLLSFWRAGQRRMAFALGLLAGGLLLTSVFFAFIVPQSPGRMADTSAALIPTHPLWAAVLALGLPVPNTGIQVAVALLAASTTRFGLYALAVYLCWGQRGGRLSLGVAIGGALLLFWVAAWAFPNVDRDIYNYILSGRVAAVYGGNPYYVPPDRFPHDVIYQYASQRYTQFAGDNKFPAWALLNIGLAWLGGDDPVRNLLLYRAMFLLTNGANLGLIALIVRQVQPRRALAALVLYGWNPIVAGYGQSKVDTVMVFFLLLSALALVRGRRYLALAALALSAWVKLITLPLIAVLWLRDMRMRRWRALAAGVLLFGIATLALYAPFWQGASILNGQLALLSNGAGNRPAALRVLLQAGFGAALIWAGYARDTGALGLFRRWAFVALLFAVFLTRIGFSWYLLTFVALAALAVEWRLALAAIVLSYAAFVLNVWDSASNNVFALPDVFRVPRVVVYAVFVLALAGAVVALQLARRGRPLFGRAEQPQRIGIQ